MVLSFDNCRHNKVAGLYPGPDTMLFPYASLPPSLNALLIAFVRAHGCRINERANKSILIQRISYTAFQLLVRVDQPLLYLIINCFMHYNLRVVVHL